MRDFIKSGHQSSDLVDHISKRVIDYLTKDTFRPARTTAPALATARNQRARSRSTSLGLDPLSELQQTWPEDWAIDKTSVRNSVRHFQSATAQLRRLFDPPSTGTTPLKEIRPLSPEGPPPARLVQGLQEILRPSIETSSGTEEESSGTTLDKGKERRISTSTISTPEAEVRPRSNSTPKDSSTSNKSLPFPPEKATFHRMSGNGRGQPFSGNSGFGLFSQQGAPNAPNTSGPSNTSGHQPLRPNPSQAQQNMPPPPEGVDPNMWNTMLQALQASFVNLQSTPGPSGPAGPEGPQGPPGQSSGNGGGFRASDLGFFHPDLEESYGVGDIVFSSKETIYREVYSFCRRVEDYAVIKGEDLVRTNLSTCFRGSALSWWLNTLSQDEKDAMMQLPTGLKRTLTRLQDRFKISMSSALDQLTRQVYTMSDAGTRRDPASYVQSVSKYAIQAGISDEHAQATWAWNHLDVELQASIPPPTAQTTLRQFTEDLDNRKELWHRLHERKESQYKDVRKEVRDKEREREKERDRDRGERAGKDKTAQKERQSGYQEAQQRPFFPSRPYIPMTGPRAFDVRTYQPRPLYPNYGYQQPTNFPQSNFPMYPPYAQQAYTPYQQNQGGQVSPYTQPPTQQPPQVQVPTQGTGQTNQVPRNGLPAPKQPLMITAGNAQPNHSQYPRQNPNFPGRGGRLYYPQRQYGGNPAYQGYGNQGFAGLPAPQPPQEAYFHDFPNENIEGYHGDFDHGYQEGPSMYHAESDDHFHDAPEDKAPEDEKSDPNEEVDVGFVSISYHATVGKMGEKPACRRCHEEFPSNNQLHKHLKTRTCQRKASGKKSESQKLTSIPSTDATGISKTIPVLKSQNSPTAGDLELIESTASSSPSNGMAFRSWHYLTGLFSLSQEAVPEPGCLDTGCPMSMADRLFLKRLMPSYKIEKHEAPITLRGIGTNRYSTNEWTTVSFFMKGKTPEGKPVMIKFTHDIHVVDNLKANLLVGMDILGPEGVIIDLPNESVIFSRCGNVSVPVQATARDNVRIRRVVRSEKRQIVPPKSTGTVQVALKGKGPLPDRDFMFEPEMQGAYAHLVDSNFNFVSIRNDTNSSLVIPRRHRIGSVVEYEAEEGYPMDVENHSLAAKSSKEKEPLLEEFTDLLTPKSAIGKMAVPPSQETQLPNGITIYGKEEYVEIMRKIAEENPRIWEDTGDTIDLPEDEWLQVPITTDWQSSSAKLGHKVYPLTPEARKLVDEKFNHMHTQGKMSWTQEPTPFAFPVFVVYKTVYVGPDKIPKRKGRVVVDIRGLNKITISDNHPLPLQDDIVTSVQGCTFISVVDCSGQFHLFLVRRDHRQRFTVVSHRGSEHFNVAAMGFKNSVPYVQRKMDSFLRPYRHFARCYIDDIVIFSKSAEEHFEHLRTIFRLFARLKITLEPKKSYLGYPSVTLLGQKVDGFGLTTTEERVAAIKEMRFPETLEALETYIGMANWLRKNVKYFAQISEPLQRLKTELLKRSPAPGGRLRKNYSKTTKVSPTSEEIEAFEVLQRALTTETYLHHYDANRQLYIDLDGSKKYGFGVMVYHVRGDPQGNSFPKADVQPIFFLSKLLNPAELRYWPTELEVAALIWTLKKIPHMLSQRSGRKVIIFTDHSSTTDITRQTTLSSSSSDRMNLRLVRASQYASQFDLDVRWRPGKQNIVPDALSRLLRKREEVSDPEATGILDDVFVYNFTLVEMSEDYRAKLAAAYKKDKKWSKILESLEAEKERLLKSEDSVEFVKLPNILFVLRDKLIYYQDEYNDRERLCVPKTLEQKVFENAHDKHSHGGFQRTYERISEGHYMRHLTRRLKRYILHCPECQVNQTKRHAPYGSLKPIITPPLIFHTITIDFILALPLLENGNNTMMTVTDKFSKRVTSAPGKDTWGAGSWAEALLLALADWGIPKGIISDRDPKFLSDLWKAIFESLGTELLVSTAYHPQTDGQSERTNQTFEIALRFHIACNPEVPWDKFAVQLRSTLNNSTNTSIGKSPNEITYGMKLNDGLDVSNVGAKDQTDVIDTRNRNRQEAADALAFAAFDAKTRYDGKHKAMVMEVGDKAFIKLHHGYHLPGLENAKLSNQRTGPFTVLARYGKLAYELELPKVWKVHPVFSVAMLEPAPKGEDPYGRPREEGQKPIVDKDDPSVKDRYEIEKLIDRQEVRPRGRGSRQKDAIVQYLVKWKNWGPAHNVWYNASDLDKAKDFMDEYDQKYGKRTMKEFRKQKERRIPKSVGAEESTTDNAVASEQGRSARISKS